jgi:hypothetical protein
MFLLSPSMTGRVTSVFPGDCPRVFPEFSLGSPQTPAGSLGRLVSHGGEPNDRCRPLAQGLARALRMTSKRPLVLAVGLLGVCAIVVTSAIQGGHVVVPRAERTTLRGTPAAVRGEIEWLETVLPGGRARDDRLWRAHLDVVARELEHGHVDAAVRAWHDAYGAALASGGWDSMIAVGDAFMTIGRASGAARGARMNARVAYLSALIRARREGSVDGALSAAQAFSGLDERAVVEQCLHIAAQLAAGDEVAQQRVREARERWMSSRTAADPEAVAPPR